MIDRRGLLLGLTGALALPGLSGCAQVRRFFQPEVSRTAIDIHTHFFNGRDVPVVGFLKQTIIRDPHAPVDPDMTTDAFLKLLTSILLVNTPTARAELDELGGRVAPIPRDDLIRRDQQNVADGIAQFAAAAGPRPTGLSTTRRDEDRLLDRIAQEVGTPGLRNSLQTPQAQARTLAHRIYDRGAGGLTIGQPRDYLHYSPLIQTIRWAGLLTRSRIDILAELDRLYGGQTGIRIFSPSLVDFGAWLVTEEDVTPIEDQIELVAAIARKYTSSLILPFAPFCPLRAALEREDDPSVDPLRNVKHAVLDLGFLGIKLYPPMGFRPIGNNTDLTWVPREPRDGPPALDRELEALYAWCVENEVPIKAHANNSIAAGPNTGTFADPAGWQVVLRDPRFKNLQLNLAHFGGFDETHGNDAFTSDSDWEATMAAMVGEFPNVYFDLGYWTDAAEIDNEDRARVLERTAALIASTPAMLDRMMYGSDFSMIGRLPSHPAYLSGLHQTFDDLGLTPAQTEAVMGGNAAAYLGLDRRGKQRARLAHAYKAHPIYQDIFED